MRRLGKILGVVAGTALVVGPRGWLAAQTPVEQSASSSDSRAAEGRDTEQLLLRRIDFDVVHASRKAAVEAAARLAKVLVQYHAEALDAYGPVTIHMDHATLGSVLDRILSGTELNVVSDGNLRLAIVGHPRAAAARAAETGTIRGVVLDSAKGRGIAGATVEVKGTKIAELTGANGAFILSHVPAGDMAVSARFLGYHALTRTVHVNGGDTATVRFVLAQSATVLSGVITTATGHQERVAMGVDVTKLNVDSIMQVAPVHSLSDLLETRVPGLTATHTSGVPGDPTRVRLRGVSSPFANNDPIVIVDGIRVYAAQSDARNANLASVPGTPTYAAPSPIDQIDPNTIETLEVFKGPSATALYGSDAANGVIVITTKHGRPGKTQWSVALNQGWTYIPGGFPTNNYRYGTPPGGTSVPCDRFAFAPGIIPFCPSADSVVSFQALNEPSLTPIGRGNDSRASATVGGGTTTMQYSLTASASNTIGVLKLPDFMKQNYITANGVNPPSWMRRPDNYKTWGVDGTTTSQFATTGRVAASASIHHGKQQRSSLESTLGMFMQEPPLIIGDSGTLSNFYQKVTDDNTTINMSGNGSWQPVAWLPLSATVGLSDVNRDDELLVPYNTPTDTNGQYKSGLGHSRTTSVNLGTEVPVPMRMTQVTVALGLNSQTTSTGDATIATSVLTPGVSTPSVFIPDSTSVTHATFNGTTYGWYTEPRFNFGSRLYVTPGFRLDGGSATGSRAGLSPFPKIDASYVMIDRQSEAPLFGVLSLFRPRVAVGTAGVQPGPTDHLRLLTTTADTINGQSVPGLGLLSGSFGNTKLRPERSREFEGGADIYLWGSRVQATVTGYRKMRYDAIVPLGLPTSLGGGFVNTNIGTVRNAGTEVTLNVIMLQSAAVAWTVSSSITRNSNVLTSLAGGRENLPAFNAQTGVPQTRYVVGYPLFGWWERPIIGYRTDHGTTLQPSDVIVGDSVVFLGAQEPNYNFVLNTSAAFFNGRLSFNATGNYTNGLTQNRAGQFGAGRLLTAAANDPNASLETQAEAVAGGLTSIGLIQKVNTVRLNSLSINFVVPKTVAQRFRAPHMSLALQGSNLYLHTNYKGKDPNVNSNVTGNGTADTGQLPLPRSWSLSVNLGN